MEFKNKQFINEGEATRVSLVVRATNKKLQKRIFKKLSKRGKKIAKFLINNKIKQP